MKKAATKKASAKPKAPKKSKKASAENPNTPAAPAATPDAKAEKAEKASAKKEPKKVWPVQKERILARHDFTLAELAEKGQSIGRIDNEIAIKQRDMKDVVADFKAQIEVKTTTRTALSQQLVNGYEMRETLSHVLYDTKARLKRYVDPHDSKKVYREEPMSESDWQLPMFRPEEVKSPKPKPGANTLEKPPGEAPKPLDPAIDEAAKAFGKVEINLDGLIGDSVLPLKMIKQFGTAAKKAGWDAKITKALKEHAATRESDGVSAVADVLRPYAVDKAATE